MKKLLALLLTFLIANSACAQNIGPSGIQNGNTSSSSSSGIAVGSTTITGGSSGNVLYDNSGIVGEYSILGTGSVVMSSELGSGITLGTSASVTNPRRSGDPTTGFYSANTDEVDASVGGTQALILNSTDVTLGNGAYASNALYSVAIGANANAGYGSSASNVLIGAGSGYDLGNATNNVGIGGNALFGAVGVSNNVGIGGNALSTGTYNGVGNNNTAVGFNALNSLSSSSASNNTVLGYSVASTVLTSGTNNILIGTSATTTTNGAADTHEIAIGGVGLGSDTTEIGLSGTTTATTLYGILSMPNASTATFGTNGTTTGTLVLANGGGSGQKTTISPSSGTTSAWTLTLPTSGGTSGYVLQTDGTGISSWVPNGSPAMVNVNLIYGAVGNGSTDNATAVQNAFNNNPNSTIYFPLNASNNYEMTGPIKLVDASGHNFQGNVYCDPGVTITFLNNGSATDADSAMQNGFQVYPVTNGSGGDTTGWNSSNAAGGHVTNCTFSGPTHGASIHTGNSIGLRFKDVSYNNVRYGAVMETNINDKIEGGGCGGTVKNACYYWAETGNSNIYYGATPASTYWNDNYEMDGVSCGNTTAGSIACVLDAGSQSERIRSIRHLDCYTGSTSDMQYCYVSRNANPTFTTNWSENVNYMVRSINTNSNEGGGSTTLLGVTGAEPAGTWAINNMPDGYGEGGVFTNNYSQAGKVDFDFSGFNGGTVRVGQNTTNSCQSGGYHIQTNQGGETILDDGDTILSGSCSYKNINYSNYTNISITAGLYTVSTLPAATPGQRALVTDQTTACPSPGGSLTGGGSVVCPVFYNGSAWKGD